MSFPGIRDPQTLDGIKGIFGVLVRLVVVELAEPSQISEDVIVKANNVMPEVRWKDSIAAYGISKAKGEDQERAEAVGQI
jgi:hypothetical protein